MKYLNILLLILLLIFALSANLLYAETDTQMSNALFSQGNDMYKTGHIDEAVNLFSRALLLDPHNERSQKALINISNSDEFSAKQKIDLLQFEDLMNYIKGLKEKVDYYENRRNELGKTLFERGLNKKDLNDAMLSVKNNAKKDTEQSFNKNTVEGHDPNDPLATVNKWLTFEKEQLLDKMMYLQKQCEKLQDISKEIDKNISEKTTAVSTDSTDSAKESISDQQKGIQQLKQELNSVDNHIDNFEKNINSKDERVDNLSSQIVDFALKLSEKEMLLSEKIKKLTELNNDLEELRARLELGQKIIEDKDQKISLLQDKLKQVNPDAARDIVAEEKPIDMTKKTDQQVAELNNMLEIYKQKINDSEKTINEKKGNIEDLNNKLVKLQEQMENGRRSLFIKDKEAQAKDKQIRSLKNTIDNLRNRSNREDNAQKEILGSKEDKLKALEKELYSYKQELKRAQTEMSNKDNKISSLENQLRAFNEDLLERDKNLQEKDDRVSSLEKQLVEIKEQLQKGANELNDSSKKKEPVIDVEILGIKNKLKEINDYLDQDMGKK